MEEYATYYLIAGALAFFVAGWCLGWYFQPRYYITVKTPDIYMQVKIANGGVQEWRWVDDADWWREEGGKPPGEE